MSAGAPRTLQALFIKASIVQMQVTRHHRILVILGAQTSPDDQVEAAD